MACQAYRIGIYDRKKKTMTIKEGLSKEDVISIIPWLKKENADGMDIFISPDISENRALILIDDVSLVQIGQMIRRGVNPACVVETSPDNYQAWISLGTNPMSSGQRKIVARIFAKEFGGDIGSTDATHFGRLAGFTNKKEKYLTAKGFPFASCRSSSGAHAKKSAEIRAWARQKELDETNTSQGLNSRTKAQNANSDAVKNNRKKKPLKDPEIVFCSYFQQWRTYIKLRNKLPDLSVGDFAVVCRMLKEGFSKEEIKNALINHSPDICERKINHIDDYANRTVIAAAKHCGISLLD
jgi:hypothetical protein